MTSAVGMVSTLLVGRPGRMLDGLRSLLKADPNLEPFFETDNSDDALKITKEKNIRLVLLDSSLFEGDTQRLIEQIKRCWPATKCVVLTDKVLNNHGVISKEADEVLPTSIPSAQLFEALDHVLA
jgi:DNA-binding NarL/FixJ family response regulator